VRLPALVLGLLLGAVSSFAHQETPTDLPVSHLSGGGPAADDCLAGVEVTGVSLLHFTSESGLML
jgi:hypothetical protein